MRLTEATTGLVRRLIICAFACSLAGCFQPTQAVMTDVDLYGWNQSAIINTENGDTTTLRDINIVIRANRNFRLDTLKLKVRVLRPDLSYFDEQISLPIQHAHRPASLRLIDEIPYRHNVVFNMMGNYCFTLKPQGVVTGIESVGINIIKSEQAEPTSPLTTKEE